MKIKILGWITLLIAAAEVVFLRWIGLDMTEGQLFITFLPAWISIVFMVLVAIFLLREK